MLGEHSSKKGDAPHQHFLCGIEVGPIHQVKGHRVGRGVGIGAYGFGYGCVQLAHGSYGVGGDFAAIQGSGEDKRPNHSLLVLIVPAKSAEPIADVRASVDAVVQRAPIQPGASGNVCAKVPKMEDNLHTSINYRQHMRSEPCPSSAAGREEVALEEGNFGSNGMEVKERDMVPSLKQQLVAWANGENCNVVGKCPGNAPCRRNSPGPWAKKKSNESHAEWAPLGDAT